ncbi:uncharacterized protein LOC135388876 isoform X3 [Ornithodoros turicata]|uniref:uncharacterized protein LOC135388876 isoform X3 n=1 Tax=Ornithodoros turicata TaxID=34597 RepID=UPI0031399362
MNVKRNLDQDWDGYWDEDLRNLSLATRNTHSFEIDGAQANVRRASLDAAAGSEGLGPCEMSAPCRWQRPVEACTRSRGSSSSDIIPKPEIFEMYETSSESTIEQPRRILPTRGGCRSFSRYGNQLPELHRRRAQIRWPDSGPKLNDNPSSRRCPATLQLSTAAGIIVLCCLLVYLLLYSSPSEFKEDTATDESLSESAEEGYEYSEQLRASLDSLKPSQEGRAALKASATSSDPSATASPTETPTGKTIAKTGFIGHAIGRPSTIATSNEPSKLPRLPDSVPYKVENAISPRCGPHFFTYCTSKASEYYYDAKTRQCTSTGPEGYAPDLCNYSRNRYRTHELCRKNCVIRNTPLMKCFEPSRLGACAQEHIRYRWWYFKDGRCQEWSFYNGTCPSEVPEGVYTSLQECTSRCFSGTMERKCFEPESISCSTKYLEFPYTAVRQSDGKFRCVIVGSIANQTCLIGPNKFDLDSVCLQECFDSRLRQRTGY